MWKAWRLAADGTVDPVEDDVLALEPGRILWIDVTDSSTDVIQELGDRLGIHELALEDLGKGGQRTKLDDYGDHWHIALYDCRLVDLELDAHEIDVLFGDGWLLTRHHGSDRDIVDDALRRFRGPTHPANLHVTDALWAVLDVIVDRWFAVSDLIDDRLEDIEDVIFDGGPAAIPSSVFALRRSLVAFRRAVGPTREVLAALTRGEIPDTDIATTRRLQDVNDHVLRVLEFLETQRELLTALLEAQLTIASNRMNQVMKATSSWGAILVLNTLIAGIYGMNFRHMPELDWKIGYPLSLLMMATVTFGGYRLFKRRDWL